MLRLGKPACFGAKQIKCLLGGGFGERLHRKDPVVPCCAADEDEDGARAPNDNGVTKADVNVHLV